MNDINDLLLGVIGIVPSLLSGRVRTGICGTVSTNRRGSCQRGAGMRTERLSTNGDLPAVGLVGNAVDLLDVVRVGDDLVVGDEVL